jgi:uncharacterized protein (TIGR02594 family)
MPTEALVSRRKFVLGTSAFALGLITDVSYSQNKKSRVNEDYRDFDSGTLPDLRPFGTQPAKSDEVAKADALLLAAPRQKLPLDVMKYLEALPDENVDNEAYNGGWRVRWNPLIVRFFTETKTTPAGDTTAWCAASLNWVLARCGLHRTESASSGSFRASEGLTDNPHAGDIVVFVSKDPDEARVGHGHVGLFLEQNASEILVLGGNQKNKFGHHAVCRKWIPKKGNVLVFHSYHSIGAYR